MYEPVPLPPAASVTPSNVVVPYSRYNSQVTPYPNPESMQKPPMPNNQMQAWAPQNPPADPKAAASTTSKLKSFVTSKLVIGTLIGVVICGVPLAVMTVLYVQAKQTPSSSSGSNSGSSGSTATNSSSALPSQCTSFATLADQFRLSTSSSCCYTADCSLAANWYRISAPGGTQLANFPVSTSMCGQSYPAWFNGSYPTTPGTTVTGLSCTNWAGTICSPSYSTSVSVTNCNGFYVFYLPPLPSCSIRYCTMP